MSEGLSVTPEGGGRQSDHEAPKKRAVLGQIRSFLNVRFCLSRDIRIPDFRQSCFLKTSIRKG